MSPPRPAAPVRLADYRPPGFLVDTVWLDIELDDPTVTVAACLTLRRAAAARGEPLHLDAEGLELLELRLDGRRLGTGAYRHDELGVTLPAAPDRCVLETRVRLHPERNTRLTGLYRSGRVLCTQCEAQGFRRITPFPDRPDVLARYTVTVTAPRAAYPVLLANGNRVAGGELPDGLHWARFVDPFPKPSYLFALVAGELQAEAGRFRTRSGREVALAVHTEPRHAGRTGHAMAALQAAMRWEEQRYGLEYDLDQYHVVAVGRGNMGAMENKGLNVFNTHYVLADACTATDDDRLAIEAVIAHEYFHNWTGNRVTLRDWFQIGLKEGLTAFREQQFTAARGMAAVRRIEQVRALRSSQFPEDAGPTAHPVRPPEYLGVGNFYSPTVYLKGAELVRMLHTLLGEDAFRRGLQCYLERHDGEAVTWDELLRAMAGAGGRDLGQFARWCDSAGTPVITAETHWHPATGTYRINLSQQTPDGRPLHVPMAIGLLGPRGEDLPVTLAGEAAPGPTTRVLELRGAGTEFVLQGLEHRPVPSLLRGFSAPVHLLREVDDEELAFLLIHDSDAFNRWEAGQRLFQRLLLAWTTGSEQVLPAVLDAALAGLIGDQGEDPALLAELLTLPGEQSLAEALTVDEVEAIHQARQHLRRRIRERHGTTLLARYRALAGAPAVAAMPAVGRRRLRHRLLDYLAAPRDGEAEALCLQHLAQAGGMTERLGALAQLVDFPTHRATAAVEAFGETWRHEPVVLDKWFRLQATARRPDALERVRALTRHPGFSADNPNRVRALIGAFAEDNPAAFHARSGGGYTFLADWVMALDPRNPQLAARLVAPLGRWRRYGPQRAPQMQCALRRILQRPGLSNDVLEIVSKSLEC